MALNSSANLPQRRYTKAEIESITGSAKHTLVKSDSPEGKLSHIVISKGGHPEWMEKVELWIRSNLELLPGYPSEFSAHRGIPGEQARYPVFSGLRFAGLHYIRSVTYLAPQSPEVCDLVARKYKNKKKRATFARHRFAIVTLARGNFGDARTETRTEQTPAIDSLENAMKSLSVEPSGPKTSLAKDGHGSDCLGAGVRTTGRQRKNRGSQGQNHHNEAGRDILG